MIILIFHNCESDTSYVLENYAAELLEIQSHIRHITTLKKYKVWQLEEDM